MIADAFQTDFTIPPEEQAAQGPVGAKFKYVRPKPANPQAAVQVRPAELMRELLERSDNGRVLNGWQPGESCGGRFCDEDGGRGHGGGSLRQESGIYRSRVRGRTRAG